HRGGQPERLQQSAEAHRRRDQRLLRVGLLLEESGSDEASSSDHGENQPAGIAGVGAERIRAQAPAGADFFEEAVGRNSTFLTREAAASRVRITASFR